MQSSMLIPVKLKSPTDKEFCIRKERWASAPVLSLTIITLLCTSYTGPAKALSSRACPNGVIDQAKWVVWGIWLGCLN